eukprot:1062220-Prorocentrum_minimum.AAC.1
MASEAGEGLVGRQRADGRQQGHRVGHRLGGGGLHRAREELGDGPLRPASPPADAPPRLLDALLQHLHLEAQLLQRGALQLRHLRRGSTSQKRGSTSQKRGLIRLEAQLLQRGALQLRHLRRGATSKKRGSIRLESQLLQRGALQLRHLRRGAIRR